MSMLTLHSDTGIKVDFPSDDASPDDVLAWAKDFGIDISLLVENLKRTPTERFERHQGALAMALMLRGGLSKAPHDSNRKASLEVE